MYLRQDLIEYFRGPFPSPPCSPTSSPEREVTFLLCIAPLQALKRYKVRIVEDAVQDMYDNLQNAEGTHLEAPEPKYNSQLYRTAPNIKKIAIKVRRPCTVFPNLKSDESCE